MTPANICRDALLQGGILTLPQTIYAEDLFKSFNQLNSMLAQWNNDRFAVFNMIDLSVMSDGSQSYTVGPGGDIDTSRPDKIMAAYVRLQPIVSNNPVDVPLQVVEAHEDYAEVPLKNLQGFPVGVFWDSAFPIGNLYVWPVPNAGQYEIHIVVKNQLTGFAFLTDTISMPPDYTDAMVWNLALRLRSVYGLSPDPTVQAMALKSMSAVTGANSQVAILKMPMGLGSSRRGTSSAWYYFTGGLS